MIMSEKDKQIKECLEKNGWRLEAYGLVPEYCKDSIGTFYFYNGNVEFRSSIIKGNLLNFLVKRESVRVKKNSFEIKLDIGEIKIPL